MTESESAQVSPRRTKALAQILERHALRDWSSKSKQERKSQAEELLQLFSSSTTLPLAPSTGITITRRPGIEEVRNLLVHSPSPSIPDELQELRSEIWQVLLHVYKRTHQGSSAQDFDRMIARLEKLPKDPQLAMECQEVGTLLASPSKSARTIQKDAEILLMWFLTTKSMRYVPGMASVVAPFFILELSLPTIYDCFYQYCASFLPQVMTAELSDGREVVSNAEANGMEDETASDDESPSSFSIDQIQRTEKQYLSELLVCYHDPDLAHVLVQYLSSDWEDPDQEIFPSAYFTGELHELVHPRMMVYIMDQYLLTQDSLFSLFLLVAALIGSRDSLLACTNEEELRLTVQKKLASAFSSEEETKSLCVLAAYLHTRTPQSYRCILHDEHTSPVSNKSASRITTDLSFGLSDINGVLLSPDDQTDGLKEVDMSQWERKESKSLGGKTFWYHKKTGKTQWEHPNARKTGPPPQPFALPVGVQEVADDVMGTKKSAHERADLAFFVVDCRALRSSDDVKSGRIPTAFTMDPATFDSPDALARGFEAFNAMKGRAHVVLVGNGVGIPPTLASEDETKTSVRDAVRLDTDLLNRAALVFQKQGFRYVSVLDGGYAAWHAYMRDKPGCSPDELLSHVGPECHYCRYDTILATGQDPMKQTVKGKRKKGAMPKTTTMLVNGGEGDASIFSTSSFNPSSGSSHLKEALQTSGSAALAGGRKSLTLSRSSLTNVKSRLSEVSVRSKLADVKLPGYSWMGWRRGTSGAESADEAGQDRSSSETAEDVGSDHGSNSAEELKGETTEEVKEGGQVERKKSFVGVFTIGDSDDEENDEQEAGETTDAAAASAIA